MPITLCLCAPPFLPVTYLSLDERERESEVLMRVRGRRTEGRLAQMHRERERWGEVETEGVRETRENRDRAQ